jgi:hypothetical protein
MAPKRKGCTEPFPTFGVFTGLVLAFSPLALPFYEEGKGHFIYGSFCN